MRKALEQNYTVKAFVRDRSRLPFEDSRVEIIEGDVHDLGGVEKAVAGAEAILSALGWTRKSRKDVLSEAAKNIVRAAKNHNVRRIIALTGYGVRFSKDPPDSLSKKLIHFALKLYAPHLLAEGTKYAHTIVESGLDWTIVRTSILSNAKGRGSYKAGYFDPKLSMVAREDVADFMTRQIKDTQYIGEAPVIGYG